MYECIEVEAVREARGIGRVHLASAGALCRERWEPILIVPLIT